MSAPRARVPIPLWIKLSVFSALLAVLPALVVSLLALRKEEATLELLIRERMASFADVVAQREEQLFQTAQREAAEVADRLGDDQRDSEERLGQSQSLVRASEMIDRVEVYDRAGNYLDTIQEQGTLEQAPPPLLPLAQREEAERAELAYGEVEAWEDELRLPLVVPIRAKGRVTGYVRCPMNLRQFAQSFGDRSSLDLPQGYRAAVVDERWRRLASVGWGEAAPLAALGAHPLQGLGQGQAASLGVGAVQLYEHPGAGRWQGALRPLPDRRWSVVVEVPYDEAYAELLGMRRTLWGLLGAAAAVSVTLALVLARGLTAPLEALTGFAQTLAERRFGEKVEVDTRDELSLLARALTRASEDLREGEERLLHEQAIRQDLGRYLPREVVEKIVRREQDMGLGGRRCQITVLFADVVSFTPLAESLPPEKVVGILNQLFTILTEIIFRHGGTVDKFIGDSVMAMWGAPDAQEDHAERAVEAAEDMLRWLEVGNATWEMEHGVKLQLAIGISSGEAVVGNLGSRDRMEYTAIGHIVNIAARLEGIAKPNQILLSRETRDRLSEDFEIRPCGTQSFPGSARTVELYEVSL